MYRGGKGGGQGVRDPGEIDKVMRDRKKIMMRFMLITISSLKSHSNRTALTTTLTIRFNIP